MPGREVTVHSQCAFVTGWRKSRRSARAGCCCRRRESLLIGIEAGHDEAGQLGVAREGMCAVHGVRGRVCVCVRAMGAGCAPKGAASPSTEHKTVMALRRRRRRRAAHVQG